MIIDTYLIDTYFIAVVSARGLDCCISWPSHLLLVTCGWSNFALLLADASTQSSGRMQTRSSACSMACCTYTMRGARPGCESVKDCSYEAGATALVINITGSVAHGTIAVVLRSGFIDQHVRLGLHCFGGSAINFQCHWMHMTRGAAMLEACQEMQMHTWRHLLMLQSLVCSDTPLVHLLSVAACIAVECYLEQQSAVWYIITDLIDTLQPAHTSHDTVSSCCCPQGFSLCGPCSQLVLLHHQCT
jgi:hypothetical protein